MKIRAAVLEEFAEPLVVQELELDGPGPGEALVRLSACGVCHTDLYTASGADPSGYAPTVLGHEGAGVVEEVGEGVTSVAPGDHVVTLFSPQCRECVHCRSPKTNLCLAIRDQQNLGYLPDGTTRLGRDGDRIRHFMGTSTFAEASVMPEIALAKVDPEAPLDVVCTLACRLAGAERIVALDLSEERLEQARAQGATDTLMGGPDAGERILELTGGFGADYTFEATGSVAVMRQAVESARMGWGLCTIAGVAGKGEVLEVIPRFLITGRRIAGASFGGAKGRDRVPELVDRYLAGDLDLDSLVTRRITLDEVNDAFAAMERQEGIRTVITF
jgi:S-(hydroxymethyl)glutathione dehydrogenase / alcohol dehydrogenase